MLLLCIFANNEQFTESINIHLMWLEFTNVQNFG